MPQAVASRYARALADAVLDAKSQLDARRAVSELQEFCEMLRGSAELRNVLLSPAVSAARKRAVVGRFADSIPISRLVRNFLFILIDRRRIDIADEVRQAFEAELDSRMGIVRADIQSAVPLTDPQQSFVQAQLSEVTGKQIKGRFSVDPNLLGGMVARIGSTVYDGSVRTQLELMRERLTSR